MGMPAIQKHLVGASPLMMPHSACLPNTDQLPWIPGCKSSTLWVCSGFSSSLEPWERWCLLEPLLAGTGQGGNLWMTFSNSSFQGKARCRGWSGSKLQKNLPVSPWQPRLWLPDPNSCADGEGSAGVGGGETQAVWCG